MDVFTGQMTTDVSNIFAENNILVTNVPPNMTRYYQPLDLTVNGSAKRFMAKKFNGWYFDQITQQLQSGKALEEVDVKLRQLSSPFTQDGLLISITTSLLLMGKR